MWDFVSLSIEISIGLGFFTILFPSYFCSVDLYVVCIVSGYCNLSFFSLFYVVFESSYWSIDAIFNASELSFSFFFLDTYSLSTSFLGCMAFCILLSFLVLWSVCWSSSFFHFKNDSGHLTRRKAQVFIPLMRILLQILVSRSFLVRQGLFFIFHFISTCLMVSLPIFASTYDFPFLRAFWHFLDLVVLIIQLFVLFRFSLLALHIFQCEIPFQYHDCIVYINNSNSF